VENLFIQKPVLARPLLLCRKSGAKLSNWKRH
jgi:hypothetical protein